MLALLVTLAQLLLSISALQVAPTWLTSNYVKAGSYDFINNVKTASGTTLTATITFPGTAFTVPPNIGYGIQKYEGTY